MWNRHNDMFMKGKNPMFISKINSFGFTNNITEAAIEALLYLNETK